MAGNNNDSRYVTLVANTVSTVTLPHAFDNLEVVNVDGVAAVYFTTDGTAPTVKGDGTVVLPASICSVEVENDAARGVASVTTVKLISTGTPQICVRGW